MVDWILDQLPGLIIGGLFFSILSGLAVNWIWEKRSKKANSIDVRKQEKKERLGLFREVIEECTHNNVSMIGCAKAPFLLNAHRLLLVSDSFQTFPEEKKDLVRQISAKGTRCNGGSLGVEATPGMVKAKCSELKEFLETLIKSEAET